MSVQLQEVQQIKVFEANIDTSMNKQKILRILSKLENVQVYKRNSGHGYQTVKLTRWFGSDSDCFYIGFEKNHLKEIEHHTKKILG